MSTSTSFSPSASASGFDVEVYPLVDSTPAGPVQFLRRVTYNSATGAIVSFTDTALDGTTAYAPVGTVGVDQELFAPVQAHHFDALTGTPWTSAAIPAGTKLVALSYSVVVGTVTVVDADGTSIAGIPLGFSAQWNAQNDREVLSPPTSITPVGVGSRTIVTMTVRTV